MALFRGNSDLLDMIKTPLLSFYRADVPRNQLFYLTQLNKIPQMDNFFRPNSVLPRL
ncbi:hypothetical protein KIN20_000906 [Parelaphostrongylus tenuis]|uniref:Uncharacterized protein n=1 Tax=Parelaphostrongylus tenuis TaxID=148309 RepID=A0AAD5QFX5_PARTN|nr:hypothetical protein KIN20_000906 [Parelaphostrongylus tenuis]